MRVNKVHTINEIKALYTEAQPKHVALINSNGGTEVFYNQAKKGEADLRMKDILKKISAKSTIAGMYFVCFKNAHTPNAVVTEYPVMVGKPESTSVTFTPMQASKSESVWSVQEAITIIGDKNRLELLLDFEKQTNVLLNERIKELEAEISQLSESNGAHTWVKDLDAFKPLAEIFFSQRDKALSLKERELGLMERGAKAPTRNDNGVEHDDAGYKNYFAAIVSSGNEDDLNYECDYLERVSPKQYEAYCNEFKITEDNDQ